MGELLSDGDKVIVITKRNISTAKNLIRNDILIITSRKAKGGYYVSDLLGKYLGSVRKSDVKPY